MSKIVRFCVRNEQKTGDNVFLVHRPSVFGNPYTHIKNKQTKALYKVKTRDDAIRLYDPYFDAMLVEDETFREEFDRMYRAFCEFDTIYLGCYCALSSSCHADVIAKKLRERAVREGLMMCGIRPKIEEKHTKNEIF